jgi:negative regulator of sigma E activity
MTDQINDQISAFIDDELSAEESALLVRRFERDPEARARALRYTLIGSALRGELLEPHPSVLRQRVAAGLNGTAPAVPKRRAATASVSRPLAGFGIAATVALVAIGSLRFLNGVPVESGVPALADVVVPLPARQSSDDPSYVVPRDVAEPRVAAPPIRLTNYLMHHGVYASSLTRTTVNSNVVGAASAETVAAIEEAAAEISAAKPVAIEPAELE